MGTTILGTGVKIPLSVGESVARRSIRWYGWWVSMVTHARGPGLARTNRGRRGAFAALVAGARHDPETMDALADTYEALPAEGRQRLVAAVRADATLASIDPRPVLLAFLGIETELGAALAIVAALGVDSEAARGLQTEDGGAVLLQPLFTDFFRVLIVPASGQGLLVRACCRLDEALAEAQLHLGSQPRPVELSEVVDTVAANLWSHLRSGGTLPDGAEHFATLFSMH